MTRFYEEIQGRKFRLDPVLLSQIREAKNFLEPKKEREVRQKQLFTHLAKCHNHTQSW